MTGPHPTVPGLTGLAVLARGGYATVYRAVQESVGREVAVKMENRTLESERDRRRFLREARAAGRMSGHPHVVDLFDAGVSADGRPYLIMELCAGSYAEISRAAPLTPGDAREVGAKIADALADAHSLGVLHRDVKPANILITRFGEPALADFGLAILAEARDGAVTLDALTPAYAPPEMFRQAAPGPSGDVYALCATLYALMRGRPARWSDDRDPSVMSMIDMFAEAVPDIPGVPESLMRLLRAGMANDPAARPTAPELRDTLLSLRLERPVAAVSTGPVPVPPVGLGATFEEIVASLERDAGDPAVPGGHPESTVAYQAHPQHGLRSSAPSNGGPAEPGAEPPVVQPGAETEAPPEPPAAPEAHGQPAGRRRAWWAIAGIAEVMIVLVSVAVWSIASSHTQARPVPPGTSAPRSAPVETPAGSGGAAAAPPGAGRPVPTARDACADATDGVARCPAAPECFDEFQPVDGAAAARPLGCRTPHTWETFAVADLPAEIERPDYLIVHENPQVSRVCSLETLASVARLDRFVGWRIDVLPPRPEAMRAGDRAYRCLAARGHNEFVEPQILRPPA